MTARVFNFSAGPAVLPVPVLEEAQREMLSLPGVGSSVLEISHRSKTFLEILTEAKQNLRQLLEIPDNYRVLFLQGGSRLQFAMVPMNLAGPHGTPQYIVTGSWGSKAFAEANELGGAAKVYDGKDETYARVPTAADLPTDWQGSLVHFTSNETIQGVQFSAPPETGVVPLVCDASSDFLCRPLEIAKYGLIYACAQKNAGPAGVTIVLIREDLLERSPPQIPGYLNYATHAEHDSLFNTAPTFGIYIVNLVTRWLLHDIGGLAAMHQQNRAKAQMLYEVIDASDGFYEGHARPDSRSIMNVVFRLPSDALQDRFLELARERSLVNLKGHRSVGGIRASIYNAMPVEGVERLRDVMTEFQKGQAG